MDRFIRVNGRDFSFEDVAKALEFEVGPYLDPVQVQLCQRVNDGVLVAKGAFFDNDDYPGMDVELELPEEKDSFPVIISRAEQPRVRKSDAFSGTRKEELGTRDGIADGDDLDSGCGRGELLGYSDGYQGVRNFVYNRDGEYFMYTDVDSRPDEVVDRDGMEQRVMVSGSPKCEVEVYQENPWVRMMGEREFAYKENAPEASLENILAEAKGRGVAAEEQVKVLSFSDEIGFTKFSVDAKWYEKYGGKENVIALLEMASSDEESGFRDLTGKCWEQEL